MDDRSIRPQTSFKLPLHQLFLLLIFIAGSAFGIAQSYLNLQFEISSIKNRLASIEKKLDK